VAVPTPDSTRWTLIRGAAALAKLPESERETLRALWRDVRALLEEASK